MMKILFAYADDYGERVIRNMINDPSYCKACGLSCDFCKYGIYTHVQNIHAAIEFPRPADLPAFIEDTEQYFPRRIPTADMCIATGLHKDMLVALPQRLKQEAVRGLIVPVEDFREVPSGLQKQVEKLCTELGIECAFPKPFCALEPNEQKPLTSQFVQEFKLGKPSLQITTEKRDGSRVVHGVVVERSAPCGSTWHIARKLIGKVVQIDEIRDAIARAHHSFPCTATMSTDPEIGEPILHKAGFLIREAVESQLTYQLKKIL